MAALFLQTLTAVFFHGVTLCIEDGSIELEFALPAECCLEVAHDSSEAAVHLEECDCTDLALTHPALDKKPEVVAVSPVLVVFGGSVSTTSTLLIAALTTSAPGDLSSPFRDRRTVVLQV